MNSKRIFMSYEIPQLILTFLKTYNNNNNKNKNINKNN